MTGNGLLGLKITIAGGAFFLGGCMLSTSSIGLMFFIAGAVIMLIGTFTGNSDPEKDKEKKEGQQEPPKPVEEKK